MTKATKIKNITFKKLTKVDKLLQIQKHYKIMEELHTKLHSIRTVDRYCLNLSKEYNEVESDVEAKILELETLLLTHLGIEYQRANKLYKEIQRESK